jgi:hypothetical protein
MGHSMVSMRCGVVVWFGVVLHKYGIDIVLQNSVIVCISNTAQFLAGMINIAGDSKMQAGVAPGIYQYSWFCDLLLGLCMCQCSRCCIHDALYVSRKLPVPHSRPI